MTTKVDTWLATLDHPLKARAQDLRQAILALDPAVAETIKWNGPSFVYIDDFATFGFRKADRLQIVLHQGVRPKAGAVDGLSIEDPAGLLTWAAKDRAVAYLTLDDDFDSWKPAFIAILRQWMAQMS